MPISGNLGVSEMWHKAQDHEMFDGLFSDEYEVFDRGLGESAESWIKEEQLVAT